MGEKGLHNAFYSGEKSSADKDTVVQVADSEKAEQAFYYNRHHGARPLPPMRPGDNIIAKLDQDKTWATPAVVSSLLPHGPTVCKHHREQYCAATVVIWI